MQGVNSGSEQRRLRLELREAAAVTTAAAEAGKLRAAVAAEAGRGNRKSVKSKQPLPSSYSITRGSRRVH